MAGEGEHSEIFLGFDFSTQQIKALAISNNLDVVYDGHVHFDSDLPEFKTQGGVHIHDDKVTITAPTTMWIKAFDLLMERMEAAKFPFHKVVAISGDGQQHGSIYWKKGSRETLTKLQPDQSMFDQLKSCFSVENSPLWMDASTREECGLLEEAVGGPQELANLTGSRAYERFTGLQIMKMFRKQREAYDNTERISIVSSFAASLFIGDYAPIDHSDGTGMNLLDIHTWDWAPKCLQTCGTDLCSKLGRPVHSTEVLGKVSKYMVSRYNMNPDCIILAFVGDNAASLAGLAPDKSDVIVSLGTSDTVFLWLTHPTPGLDGHILGNPLEIGGFMSLTCFKNGSLTRERIRDERAEGSWDKFSEMLQKTSPGNNGNLGIYLDVMEIQPFAEGVFRFDSQGKPVDSFPAEVEVRAVVEGQFIARRVHAENLGMNLGPTTKVLATGGGSKNKDILQVLADVFNSPVYVKDVPNSACLGCALRAKQAYLNYSVSFSEISKGAHPAQLVASPGSHTEVYKQLCARYRQFEEQIQAKTQ